VEFKKGVVDLSIEPFVVTREEEVIEVHHGILGHHCEIVERWYCHICAREIREYRVIALEYKMGLQLLRSTYISILLNEPAENVRLPVSAVVE
jgi:hypothetical protein